MFEMSDRASDRAQPFNSAESAQRSTLGGNDLGVPATLPEQRSQATTAAVAGHDVLDGGSEQRQRSAGLPPIRRWVQRAEGDRRRRARLRILEGEGVIVLSDRRIPGSRTSIKLIAVSPAGVFVIDTKNYKGLVHTMRPGPIANLGPQELHVGRRNCTSSVEQVAGQMLVVRASLDSTSSGSPIPVYGMLCLTRAEWGFPSAIQVSDVWVGWPRFMAGQVQAPGMMDPPAVQEVSRMIADYLPVA